MSLEILPFVGIAVITLLRPYLCSAAQHKELVAQFAETQSQLEAEKGYNDDLKKHRKQLFNRILELRRERDLLARELEKHKPTQGPDGRFIKKS